MGNVSEIIALSIYVQKRLKVLPRFFLLFFYFSSGVVKSFVFATFHFILTSLLIRFSFLSDQSEFSVDFSLSLFFREI